MADALTPDGVRTRQFDAALRGYDRAQVDAFLAEIATRLDELERSIDEREAVDPSLGIDDREALARELHLIGGEVGDILEAARSAAEHMRGRAAADAREWTTEAQREADDMVANARQQSQAARASAWKEGTALLASAAAEAAAMLDAAREETLFVRAEAEREALRHTGDAKRDREETIRAARAEAEAMIERARAESEAVLRAAHQQAEQAQERARALEDRRAELLAELEAARASISHMENEIESKRQELEAPVPDVDDDVERSHHGEDSGSVRIVAPSAVMPLAPVDAEELVAEVTALRSAPPPPAAPTAPAPVRDEMGSVPTAQPATVEPVPHTEPEPAPQTEPEAPVYQPVVGDAAADSGSAQAATAPPAVTEPPPSEPAPPERSSVAPAPATEPSPAAVPESAEVAVPDSVPDSEAHSENGPADDIGANDDEDVDPDHADSDDIDSLFARLRSGSRDEPDTIAETATEDAAVPDVGSADLSDDAATPRDLPPGPAPVSAEAEVGVERVEATDQSDDAPPASPPPADDAEARMVTARNAALRIIKRSLVELQNESLENLRTDDGWLPSEDFTDRFREPFAELTASLSGVADDTAGAAFASDLFDAVTSAIEHARSVGAGDREVAAAASKVFRMWRSDEAERRVIDAATVVAV